MSRPKIYLAGPISGLTWEEATAWRDFATDNLRNFDCISPLRGARGQPGAYFNPNGERWTTMNRILARDHADVIRSDGILVNFVGARKISKGTIMEVAWAFDRRIPIFMSIEGESNPNWDVFMNEMVPFMEPSLPTAIQTLRLFFNRH